MPMPIRVLVTQLIREAEQEGDKEKVKRLKEWREELKESGEWQTGYASTTE